MLSSSISTRGIDNIVPLLDTKKQGIYLHTMKSSDSKEVDFSKPLAEKVVIQLLANTHLRNDFIMHYPHFNSDGNRRVFSRLNLIAYQHTTQRLVKLQAAINLSLQHDSYISKVSDILKNECDPTAFYRLVSNLEWLDDRQRGLFITLVEQLLYTKAFQEGVLSDLRVRLRSLIK